MTAEVRLILASASPARRRLLAAAGIDAQVIVSHVEEETASVGLGAPADVALGLAVAKARNVAERVSGGGPRPSRLLVLGCDSVLEVPGVPELAGRALGKPADAADATRRWHLMAGQQGLLHTGHCLIDLPVEPGLPQREFSATASTGVDFGRPTAPELAAYIASGEPLRVAGASTLDGLGGAFVEGVRGDPSNVVGLSLPLLRSLAARAGVSWPSLWSGSQP